MARAFAVFGFAGFALLAAACGGGANGGGMPANSGASEQASRYRASLNWPGSGFGAFGGNTSFGITSMFVTIPFAGTAYSDAGLVTNQVSFGVGLAPPSPLPSGVPISTPQPPDLLQIRANPVTWTLSGLNATVTPEPQFDSFLGPTVDVRPGSVTGKSTLIATAVGEPVNVGVSVAVYTYRVVDIGCADPGALGGASFTPDPQGGRYVPQTDPSASDIFITGPACSDAFSAPAGTLHILHVPYGGILINTDGTPPNEADNHFFTLSPRAWTPAFTQLDEHQFQALYAPCSLASDPRVCFARPNYVLLFKTRDGNVVKMNIALSYHATTSGRNIAGAFEVSSNGSFPF